MPTETPLRKLERLRHERADTLDELRGIADTADRENRDLSSGEKRRFDLGEKQFERLAGEIEELEKILPTTPGMTRSIAGGQPDAGSAPSGMAAISRRAGDESRMVDWAISRDVPDQSGLSQDEVRNLSLGRAIRGMVTGRWEGAESEQRALSVGTDSAGGFLTPEVLGASVIDRVRNKAKVLQAGARVIPMESDTHHFPRLATGVTGGWKAENAAVTKSNPAFERITFEAKTLAVLVELSYELFDDLSDEGVAVIENELVQALSLEVDRASLRGSGSSNQPEGIRNQTGVTLQSLGANGAVPTAYAPLVEAVAALQADNVEPNASIYSARTAKTFSGMVDTTGQPLRKPPLIEGLQNLVSNQIPENLTQGSNSDTSEIYTGKWDDLLIGVRPRVRIEVQRTANGEGGFPVNVKASSSYGLDTMTVGLLAWIRADVQLAHPESFVVSTGVRA
ncbi:phage major capsid protein [Thermoleophilia bacterium SCSIO 60948]|nr:phage major capsid protein [Thermoleophilia bacterium SCSIO 60948]